MDPAILDPGSKIRHMETGGEPPTALWDVELRDPARLRTRAYFRSPHGWRPGWMVGEYSRFGEGLSLVIVRPKKVRPVAAKGRHD